MAFFVTIFIGDIILRNVLWTLFGLVLVNCFNAGEFESLELESQDVSSAASDVDFLEFEFCLLLIDLDRLFLKLSEFDKLLLIDVSVKRLLCAEISLSEYASVPSIGWNDEALFAELNFFFLFRFCELLLVVLK